MTLRLARHLTALAAIATLAVHAAGASAAESKLDGPLRTRAAAPRGWSRVIIRTTPGISPAEAIRSARGTAGRRLPAIDSQVALVPDLSLTALAERADVRSVSLDRRVQGTLERTGATIGAPWVHEQLGVDGTGVGVAIIDSGIADWHNDLGGERVVHFADFVSYLPQAHDDYGHGTHVAGIIAGSGHDSGGLRRGVAPGANLVVLKVLDGAGDGYISSVIAAIDYAIERRAQFNIRVLNLSVAAGVHESYATDPFTLAARRAVDAGIVVVTAAGNLGRSDSGQVQRGGITAPGNAPWVLTVGATNHQRTAARADDTLAAFSSRGPTLIDRAQKPDVVAPGVAIESLAAAGSTIYNLNAAARLSGVVDTAAMPYLSMTGTSMAAPVVAGTVALMLQANPDLTPNLVKAILQYTAERRPRIELAAQGGGFLNARGAVQLAAALFAGSAGARAADPVTWARHIIWGNTRVRGGSIAQRASAWRGDVGWGDAATPAGDPVVWGTTPAGEPWMAAAGSEPVALDEEDAAFSGFSVADARRWSSPAGSSAGRHEGPPALRGDERRRTRRHPDVQTVETV